MTPANVAIPAAVFPGTDAPIDKLDLSDFESRVNRLREMMLVGLAAYGEIERIDDQIGLYRMAKVEIPPDLRVIHPTGSATTICEFADALRCIDSLTFEVTRLATEAARKAKVDGALARGTV